MSRSNWTRFLVPGRGTCRRTYELARLSFLNTLSATRRVLVVCLYRTRNANTTCQPHAPFNRRRNFTLRLGCDVRRVHSHTINRRRVCVCVCLLTRLHVHLLLILRFGGGNGEKKRRVCNRNSNICNDTLTITFILYTRARHHPLSSYDDRTFEYSYIICVKARRRTLCTLNSKKPFGSLRDRRRPARTPQ